MMRTVRVVTYVVMALLGLAVALHVTRNAYADPPAGKVVAEVLVSGNRIRPSSEILAVFGLRPDQTYIEEQIRSGTDKLYAKGWFTPNGIELRTVERPAGKINVILYVTELTNFIEEIKYVGADHLNKTELDQLTGLRVRMPMSPHLNQQARLNILRKYQEMGRIHASVTLREGTKLEDRKVVFDIVEGPVVKIDRVDFEFVGKHESGITSGRLREQLTISRSWVGGLIGGDYNAAQIEFDTTKLTEYYHGLGFLDARVSREITHSADHRYVNVTFFVEEGQRYRVGRVQISGNKTFSEQKLLEYTDLREANYYDKKTISGDLRRIRDLYGYTGRSVGVREEHPEPEPGKGIVQVHYEVMEAQPSRVGEVTVIGNTVTQDRIIRRELPPGLQPGQILAWPDVAVAQENLSRLGIFKEDPMNGVRPQVEVLEAQGDSPFRDVLIRVQETQTGSFMVGAGINSDAGITGSVVLNERNFDILNFPTSWDDIVNGRAFRGGGQEFRLEAVPGNQLQRYTVSWRDPRIFDSLYSLSLSGYYYQRSFTEYLEERLGGRVSVGRRLNEHWSVSVSERVEEVTISQVPIDAPLSISRDTGSHFLAGTSVGLRRDSRDNYLRPTDGSIFDISYEQVFGDYQYGLATAEYTSFWSTWSRLDGSGKHVLAFRSQASWAGSDTPVYDRLYAGGFRSIRGFEFRGVGPHEGINDYNVGGTFAFLNSLEYQIPIVPSDSLYLVGFVDSGTVTQSISLADYRVTAGVGLRISMPQLLGPVPLAIDFGFPLRQAPGDKTQVFSFWLGVFGQ
jgi:outer membrane protein assembly complex protein YaeT